MNYICRTENGDATGYAIAILKVGRASSPTNFYRETKSAMDCPLFSKRQPLQEEVREEDNGFRKARLLLTTSLVNIEQN